MAIWWYKCMAYTGSFKCYLKKSPETAYHDCIYYYVRTLLTKICAKVPAAPQNYMQLLKTLYIYSVYIYIYSMVKRPRGIRDVYDVNTLYMHYNYTLVPRRRIILSYVYIHTYIHTSPCLPSNSWSIRRLWQQLYLYMQSTIPAEVVN